MVRFFLYLLGVVCILVVALFFGAFDALHISAPAVFASLGAIALIGFTIGAFVALRKKWGSMRTVIAIVAFWGVSFFMMLLCDAIARRVFC